MIDQIPRRDVLWRFGGGLGGIALASILGEDGLLAGTERRPASRDRAPTRTAGCITAPRCAG